MGAPPSDEGVTSNGVFAHDDPLKHSLLLLILQIVIILSFSRLLSFAFRPLRQPRVVADIISGILLGPTGLGNVPGFSDTIFPKSSLGVLGTVAHFGLIFFLFLVGLELDLGVLRKTGSKAVAIAGVGIVVPFALGVPVSLHVFEATGMPATGQHFGLPFVLFMGIALSITAFPVLAKILAERKIMGTEVGRIAISAAALNDVAAWVLLSLAVGVTGSASSPLLVLWVLIAGFVYLGVMFVVVHPLLRNTIAKKDPVPEYAIGITFLLVLLSSFATDVIGINVIFGAFIMGLIIPKDQPLSGVLIEKTEDFASILFLPLYFVSSGLNVELRSMSNGAAVATFLLVTATALVGKVAGTMVVAKLYGFGLRSGAALGFLMSTKGLVELVVLNIGLSRGVINKEIFAVMVLMALVLTVATTPMIMWLYKPARDLPPYKRRTLRAKWSEDDKLRMLVCLYGMRNVPSMMNVVELSKGRNSKLFQVNALHLLDMSDRHDGLRVAEILQASEPWNDEADDPRDLAPAGREDPVATSMRTFGKVNKINVKVRRSVSRVSSMHEDICAAAVKSRANVIILPYHKYSRADGSLQSAGSGFLQVNQRVLKESPCSVAILVDRGLGESTNSSSAPEQPPHNHILVLFFGGPDDREALWLAKRLADHGTVKLTIVRCVFKNWTHHGPATLDSIKVSSKDSAVLPILASSKLERSKDCIIGWGRRSLHCFRTHDAQEGRVLNSEPALHPPELRPVSGSQTKSRSQSFSSSAAPAAPKCDGTTQPTHKYSHHTAPSSLHHQSPGPLSEDHIQVHAGQLEQEQEENCDDKTLGVLLAAAENLPDRISVKALEMDEVEELLAAGEYGLIVVGLHSSRLDHGFRNALLTTTTDNVNSRFVPTDLGTVGNWLISKESLSIRSSLLVIWQHDPSHSNLSLGRRWPKCKVSDDEVVHSVVNAQQESPDHE